MKYAVALACLFAVGVLATPAHAGVGVNVGVGVPLYAPAPVYAPPPAYYAAPPAYYYAAPPAVYPAPAAGVYVSPGPVVVGPRFYGRWGWGYRGGRWHR
jgi:hypothetical protein